MYESSQGRRVGALHISLALLVAGAAALAVVGARDLMDGHVQGLPMLAPALIALLGLAQLRHPAYQGAPPHHEQWMGFVWLSLAALAASVACLASSAPIWLAFVAWFGTAVALITVLEELGLPGWGAVTPWG